jgi:spore coat protein U-like protein
MTSRAYSDVPIGLAALAGLFLAAAPAAAQVQSEPLRVEATVAGSCNVTSASLIFGAIDLGADNDADGSIDISCTTNTPFSIELDAGINDGSGNLRWLSNGVSTIEYNLYQDSNRALAWPAGTPVSAPIAGTGSVPVYGTIPQNGTAEHGPGLYTDEVTITLSF